MLLISCQLTLYINTRIGVGAGKFLGVQRIKKNSSCHFGRHVFQIKACCAPYLLIFSGSLHRFSRNLWRFSEILPGFYRILPGFSPNQNFWGCACTPCAPASCTSEYRNYIFATRNFTTIKAFFISLVGFTC